MNSIPQTAPHVSQRDAFARASLQAIHVGGFLGLYDALAAGPALSVRELAERTGTHEAYVRTWTERQADLGLLEEVPGSMDAPRFRMAADLVALRGEAAASSPFLRRLW